MRIDKIDKKETVGERLEREVVVNAPDAQVVDLYEKSIHKGKSWWTRIVTSVDTWHRWVDLILKISVSAVIVILLWRWLSFVIEAIKENVLSDSVQIALVSGSTINLIGLLAIMARYLFPKPISK